MCLVLNARLLQILCQIKINGRTNPSLLSRLSILNWNKNICTSSPRIDFLFPCKASYVLTRVYFTNKWSGCTVWVQFQFFTKLANNSNICLSVTINNAATCVSLSCEDQLLSCPLANFQFYTLSGTTIRNNTLLSSNSYSLMKVVSAPLLNQSVRAPWELNFRIAIPNKYHISVYLKLLHFPHETQPQYWRWLKTHFWDEVCRHFEVRHWEEGGWTQSHRGEVFECLPILLEEIIKIQNNFIASGKTSSSIIVKHWFSQTIDHFWRSFNIQSKQPLTWAPPLAIFEKSCRQRMVFVVIIDNSQ